MNQTNEPHNNVTLNAQYLCKEAVILETSKNEEKNQCYHYVVAKVYHNLTKRRANKVLHTIT